MLGFLKERIYLQILLLYALGIALGAQLIMPHGLPGRILFPALGVLLGLLGLHYLWQRSHSLLATLPAGLAIICSGFLYCNVAIHEVTSAPLLEYCSDDSVDGSAVVASLPKYQRGHLRFLASLSGLPGSPAGKSLGRCQFYLQCEPGFVLNPGDRIRFHGALEEVSAPRNRGQFNYRAYLLQRGTIVTCYLPSPRFLDIQDASGSRRLAWLTVLRSRLMDSLTAGLPEDLRDLAVSVVYGDKITDLDDELQERFRRAGLTHILVASGTQVSLLILLLAMALWRSPRSFDSRGTLISILQFVVTISVVAIYAGITGYETSIVRALCMGLLLCAGRLFLRNVDGLSTLSQAGLVLLLAQPLQLFTPGFQLSFLATFGLIYMMGTLHPLIMHIGGWRRFLLDGLLTTGGAQLFVTPVLAASFNQFSLVGLLSNLLAVPLSLVLLICGALSSFGLSALPLIGPTLNWLVMLFSLLLDRLATLFSDMPYSSIAVTSPPAWFLLAFYLLLLLAGECFRNREVLSARQLAILQPVCLLLGWLLSGWIAMRWILPHPELSLLRLERSFAVYLEVPGAGRHLLASSYWLGRRHNADNLISSLKARGVSRLDTVLWLDGIPQDNPLESLAETQQDLAASTPGELPFIALPSEQGRIAGLVCQLSGRNAAVVWDPAALGHDDRDAWSEEVDAWLVVESRDKGLDYPALSLIKQAGNASIGWISVDADVAGEIAGWLVSDAEICIKPAPEDRLSTFTIWR